MNPEQSFYSRHAEVIEKSALASPEDIEKIFSPSNRCGAVSLALVELGPFQKALKIGCGYGEPATRLSEQIDRVIACDNGIANRISARSNEKLQFVEANANEQLPFAKHEFGLVVALMVIEHVFDPFHFCDEVARALRAGRCLS